MIDNQLIGEIQIADKAVDDLRLIYHNLTPILFIQKGLVGALNEIPTFQKNTQIEFIHSGESRKLDWDTELSIFRIAKELINNSIKHAKAQKIEVQLIYFKDFLYLSIEDDGVGMPKKQEKMRVLA